MLIFRQGIIFFGRADNVIGRNKLSLTVCKVLTDTTCSHSLLRHDLTELVSCKRDTSLSFMQPRRDHFIYALLAGISIVALDQAPFSIPDHPFFPELTLGGSTRIKDGDSIGIFIGPEGGFDEKEIEKAIAAGIEPVTLGRRILRTETAAMTVMSWLVYIFES